MLCDEDVAPGTYLQPWFPLVYNRKGIVRYTDGISMYGENGSGTWKMPHRIYHLKALDA